MILNADIPSLNHFGELAADCEINEILEDENMPELANVELAKCKAILGMQLEVDRFGQTWDKSNLNTKEILARSAHLNLDIALLPWVEVSYANKLLLKGAAKRFKTDFQEIIRSITP